MGNTVYNIHAKASLPCVHLPVIAIAGKGDIYWPDDVPEAIRKSCVLWYDPARQGCTNERMAANPVLKDLSGNGHDATCYNFAWTEESGIGTTNYPNALVSDGVDDYAMVQNKYAVDFTYKNEYNSIWLINSNRATGTIEKSKITITSISNLSIQVYYQCTNSQTAFNVPKTKVKITGLTDGQTISYYDSANSFEDILIDSDGIYELPTFESNGNGTYYGFKCNKLQDTCNITIEQLPINKSLILTKEQGFTVLAKRKWISDINSKSQGLATKGTSAKWIDGAFYFEGVEANGTSPFNRVFDNSNGQRGVNYVSSFTENDITYLTSKEYNGSPLNNIGDGVDTDKLELFKLSFDTTNLSSIALYSFILFDRDLASGEIDWVKTNILGEANQ